MRKQPGMAAGRSMARRVCREIVQCGFASTLAARYVPETRAVRIGVPTAFGTLDAAIDYPCEPKLIDRFLGKLRRQASRRIH
jgi:hypothetical protein